MSEDFYNSLSADELAKIENMTLEEFRDLGNIARNFQPRQLKIKQQNPVDDFDDSFDDLVDEGFIDISDFNPNLFDPTSQNISGLSDFAPRNITPSNQSLENLRSNFENLDIILNREITPSDFITNSRDAIVDNRQAIQNIINKFDKAKTPLTNRSGFTRNDMQDLFPNTDLSNISDAEFKMTYLTPKGELIKRSPNKLPDFDIIPRREYEDIFNSRLDLLNDIIEKNRKSSSKPYEITGLRDGNLNFKSEFGNSDWKVDITPGLFRGQVEDIPNAKYISDFPGLSMYNTLKGVYGKSAGPIKGSRAYESINEYLKKLDLGRVKSGFSGQTPSSRGLWESVPRKSQGFGIYLNPREVAGIYYKEGGEPYTIGDEVDYETMMKLKELGYEFE